MHTNYRAYIVAAVTAVLAPTCFAVPPPNSAEHYPFYAGVSAGYGTTTWRGLVPNKTNQNVAMSMSTPVNAREGGGLWGLYAGYEVIQNFEIELSYMHYPISKVIFSPDSLFAFDHNGQTYFKTHTETTSLMGKILLPIPGTKIHAYSSVGASVEHRWDEFFDHNRVTPSFGLGFNYNLTNRLVTELGAIYTAGYGEAELNPTEDYIPFLYSVYLRLAYRF